MAQFADSAEPTQHDIRVGLNKISVQSPAGFACVVPSSLPRPFKVTAGRFHTLAMEEMLARVAALEEKIATDHFKKVFEISCNVTLQRLETCEKEIKWRMERIVNLASRRCNDTIERNGIASKMQRGEVKDLVMKLETRVDSQTKGVNKNGGRPQAAPGSGIQVDPNYPPRSK